MKIRKGRESDYSDVWKIFRRVIKNGDTYVYDPNTPKENLETLWFAENMETYVAEIEERIVGTYFIKPNQIDLGSHIANAGYMVDTQEQRRGIGKFMCEDSLERAKKLGFLAVQFNFVVSTNTGAIELWEQLGFETVGTIPKAFNHHIFGMVDTHIMFKKL